MTLVYLSLSPNGFDLTTDSLVMFGERVHAFDFKTHVMPPLRAALATRGPTLIGGLIAYASSIDPLPRGIESMRDLIVAQAGKQLANLRAEGKYRDEDLMFSAVLAGWDPEAKAFSGWYWDPTLDGWKVLGPGTYFQPGGPDTPPPWVPVAPFPTGPDRCIKVAKAVRRVTDPSGQLLYGGELWMTSVKRDGYTVRRIHRFDDYDTHAAMIADSKVHAGAPVH